MTEVGRDPETLLRAVEHQTEATSDDRARMRRMLAKRLGTAAIAASAAGSISSTASGTTLKLGSWLAKAVKVATVLHGVPLALAVGAAASLPIVHAARVARPVDTEMAIPSGDAPRALSRAWTPEAPAEAGPSTTPQSVEPSPDGPSVGRPSRAASRRSTQSAPSIAKGDFVATRANEATSERRPDEAAASLLDEYRLISRMHRALGARDEGDLSRAIEEHGRRFASGVLAEEREAMRAMLDCMRASSIERAKSIAARFVAMHPRSLHAARVETSCNDFAR